MHPLPVGIDTDKQIDTTQSQEASSSSDASTSQFSIAVVSSNSDLEQQPQPQRQNPYGYSTVHALDEDHGESAVENNMTKRPATRHAHHRTPLAPSHQTMRAAKSSNSDADDFWQQY